MKIVGRPTNTPTNPALFGGATDEQVSAAVANYIAKNPVSKPTDEQIASAVEGYLEEHPVEIPEVNLDGYAKSDEIPTDDHINSLINSALGVIENGTY